MFVEDVEHLCRCLVKRRADIIEHWQAGFMSGKAPSMSGILGRHQIADREAMQTVRKKLAVMQRRAEKLMQKRVLGVEAPDTGAYIRLFDAVIECLSKKSLPFRSISRDRKVSSVLAMHMPEVHTGIDPRLIE